MNAATEMMMNFLNTADNDMITDIMDAVEDCADTDPLDLGGEIYEIIRRNIRRDDPFAPLLRGLIGDVNWYQIAERLQQSVHA